MFLFHDFYTQHAEAQEANPPANASFLRQWRYSGNFELKYIEKSDTAADFDPNTNSVYVNIKSIKEGRLDSFYDLMSVIQHEADPKFGHKGEKMNKDKDRKIGYTFLEHAEVYLQQSSTGVFSKTTEDFRVSNAIEYGLRIWNAYKNDELNAQEMEEKFKLYTLKNLGKIKLDFDYYQGSGNIDIKVSVNGVDREPVRAKIIDNPEN